MRYRQQKTKSQGFRLKMCCNFYVTLEIQSFNRSLITLRYHNLSIKVTIINRKTRKFCTCESIQWMRIDLIESGRESIRIE